MSAAANTQVLMLGLAGSGKTTLLIQLFGRLQANPGALRLRESPRNLARLEAGLTRLNQGLPVQHTPPVTSSFSCCRQRTRSELRPIWRCLITRGRI